MAGVNNQTIHDNYTPGNPSDPEYYMNPNYTYYYNHPWNQMHGANPDYANSGLLLNQTVNRGSNGISLQPPNQLFFSGTYSNNNVSTSENEPFYNPPSSGYVGNNENLVNSSIPPTNCNSSNTVHPPQMLAQSPPAPTYPNNATDTVPNAGCVIIIMKANINLERLLSFIQ